jgi:hypothetical protein
MSRHVQPHADRSGKTPRPPGCWRRKPDNRLNRCPGYTHARHRGHTGYGQWGGQSVVQTKKIGLFVVVVFVLYVIITDPAKAADYVQIGFEGVSSAAQSIGDFMTWVVNGGGN